VVFAVKDSDVEASFHSHTSAVSRYPRLMAAFTSAKAQKDGEPVDSSIFLATSVWSSKNVIALLLPQKLPRLA
jgi:hypothetical protein